MRYLFSSKRAPSGSKGAKRMERCGKLEHACTWANSHIMSYIECFWHKLIYDYGGFTFNSAWSLHCLQHDGGRSTPKRRASNWWVWHHRKFESIAAWGWFPFKCIQFSCVSFLNLTFSWNSVRLWEILGDYQISPVWKDNFGIDLILHWNPWRDRTCAALAIRAGQNMNLSCTRFKSFTAANNQVFVDISKTSVSSHTSWIQIFVSVHINIYIYFFTLYILFRNPCCVKVEHESFNHDISALTMSSSISRVLFQYHEITLWASTIICQKMWGLDRLTVEDHWLWLGMTL